MSFTETLQSLTGKLLADCTDQELYLALLELVRQKSADRVQPVTGRKLYYISAEFLIGKLLSNNLINLGLYEEARDALAAAGKRLSDIEEVEPEPSLGNGGLGRLAACFLDSLATLNLPGDGVGLRYHFGLFHQSFEDGVQNEKPDPWLTAHSWAEKTDITYPVELAGKEYTARLYKLAVTGYEGRTNTLNLFDLDTIDESIVHDGIAFDKTAIDKNLTLFLYPDDSDEADPAAPQVEKIHADGLLPPGMTLCVTDTRGSHSELTGEFAAIRQEMEAVAACLGGKVLGQVPETDFWAALPRLRTACGDRAVLRAIHYYEENARTLAQRRALLEKRFADFAALVLESGRASFALCQNVYCATDVRHQGLSVALALSQSILQGSSGAWRMQGGGFAGTIQAYVPETLLQRYHTAMERVFGPGSCYVLRLREQGARQVL